MPVPVKSTAAVLVILLAILATAPLACADVIPFFGRRPLYRSSIMLTPARLPVGMVLLFVNSDGKLLGQAKEGETLAIREAGVLYGAWARQMPASFSFKKEKTKLVKLRTIDEESIPSGYRRPPMPSFQSCAVAEMSKGDFVLSCQDAPPPGGEEP